MAATKLSTLIQRSNHRMVAILVYSVLEWILISLLFLDSFISYLAYRFASSFGLKTPCLFCSRLEHLFHPEKGRNSYRDLLCDDHAAEVSLLGYCSNHRRLAEATDMCEECSSSRPGAPMGHDVQHPAVALLSLIKSEREGKDLNCSCCHVPLESGFYSLDLPLKPSWVCDTQIGDSIQEKGDVEGGQTNDRCLRSKVVEGNEIRPPAAAAAAAVGGILDYYQVCDSQERVVPVELIDSATLDTRNSFAAEANEVRRMDPFLDLITAFGDNKRLLLAPADQSAGVMCKQQIHGHEEPQTKSEDSNIAVESAPLVVIEREQEQVLDSEDGGKTDSEANYEVTIGSEICDQEHMHESQLLEHISPLVGQLYQSTEICEGLEDNGLDNSMMDVEANQKKDLRSEFCDVEQTDNPQLPHLAALVDMSAEIHDQAEDKDSKKNDKTYGEDTREASVETEFSDLENVDNHELQVPISSSTSEATRIIDLEDTCEVSFSNEICCCKKQIDDDPQLQEQLPLSFGDSGNSSGIYDESEVIRQRKSFSCFHLEIEHRQHNLYSKTSLNDTTVSDGEGKTDHDDNWEGPVRNEMCNQDQIDQSQLQQPLSTAVTQLEGGVHVSVVEPLNAVDHGVNCQLSTSPQLNETEEERAPETPNSLEGMYNFHKRFLFDRKDSGAESMDGSIASEVEVSEVSTVDQLKAALKAERRALSAVYAELEEERSASAIAANQTMAMITRLQEEKAAMQMEALQYQRMMEEQSEYDQEALHLLNDLMMKKEKEKQELEKELEMYQKKVLLYKAKERRTKSANATGRSGTSPASSSAEDSDDLSVDPNEGEEHLYGLNESGNSTPVDSIFISGAHHEHTKHLNTLNESLADFEEERISILEELKVLEEKLFAMDEGKDFHVEDSPENNNLLQENGHGLYYNKEFQSTEVKGNNGSNRNVCCNGKRLLPLFDATLSENEDSLKDHELMDVSRDLVSKLTPERKNHAITEEMDHIYKRLHVLEVDTEFLKHSIRSMRDGGKGLDLLLEILQRLRDLRNLDLCIRDTGNDLASFSI